MFATDQSMDVQSLAVAAEERGFDSIWIPEHTHIPISRKTAPPTGEDELLEEYKRSLDPLIALAAAAAVTTRIHLGTGVMLPAQRDPIVTAKAIATLQNIAGGRFELGIGFGWNVDEMEDHGVTYSKRREQCREHVLAMQSLWSNEVGEFHGEFVDVSASWSWPKPQQEVPVLIGGGAGPKMFRHLSEYADGWIPIGGAGLAESIPLYKQELEKAGRDPEAARIVPFGSLPTIEKLEHFRTIGVTEVVFRVPSAGESEVMPILDQQADLLEQFRR